MMQEILDRLEALERKFRRIVRPGVVNAVIADKGAVRVEFADADGIVSGELPVLCPAAGSDRVYALPDVGESVLCVFLPYAQEQGFVLGAHYTATAPTPAEDIDKRVIEFSDGSRIEYDRAAHSLTVGIIGDVGQEIGGALNIVVSGPVSVASDDAVTITAASGVEIDGGTGAGLKVAHEASVCPIYGVSPLNCSSNVKVSP